MKKSLIALAVIGFSGAAMAQSSVTLYGVADAGVGRIKSAPSAAQIAGDALTGSTHDRSGKTEFISGSLMNNTDSRLGVRGVEDLGGGLKAGFNFETGLDLDTGGAATPKAFWQRAANLWLGGNWGTFKMGRSLTPSFYGVAAWELTGAANYTVVGNTFGWAGSGSRNDSAFSYKTPNMGGFSAEVAYITKSDMSGNNAKWDVNGIYANGPITVGLSANKVQQSKTNWSLGGKYNFGNFAVAAGYHDAKGRADQRRGYNLGGTATFGAASVTLDLTRDSKRLGKKYTNGLLEGKYALSKRTFVYGAYLRLDGNNNYGIGVRHNF